MIIDGLYPPRPPQQKLSNCAGTYFYNCGRQGHNLPLTLCYAILISTKPDISFWYKSSKIQSHFFPDLENNCFWKRYPQLFVNRC